ncbi:site-specific integrase [Paenibacillus periandrae]|uniref:site-specific integrase n=1 Tax=Paenibacillus periandrae TaxID=1761741 RepID=UPI001F09957B|nr:site-specific integrase [Paenibacillus periandrae]
MEQAKKYVTNSKAENTLKSYRSDWKHFKDWCKKFQLPDLPTNDDTYALYLSNLAFEGFKASTIQRRMSAISQAHTLAGHESPSTTRIKTVWAGIRRLHGTAETGKHPILIDTLKQMISEVSDKHIGVRDRALLLIGFVGGFRRSELVNLDIDDVSLSKEGLIVRIRKSKTDQEGRGELIGLPYGSNENTCPVKSYLSWTSSANITSGPIFRPINRHNQILDKRLSGRAVALIVKRYAEAIGLDETLYAGHSLRSGIATTLAMLGKSERSIMRHTRHKSEAMVRRYIRTGSLFSENVVDNIGL